jgi:hypothetical protein
MVMAEAADGLEIRVETADLRQVAGRLRGDKEATLEPRSAQVGADFVKGVPFGANSASGYVFAAKTVYSQALERAVHTVTAYTAEVDRIAGATEAAAGNYDQVDSAASVRLAAHAQTGAPTAEIPAPRPGSAGFVGPVVSPTAGFIGPVVPAEARGPAVPQDVGRPAIWCTNWDAYDTRALWQMVEGDDIATGRTQVQTWAAVESAVSDQLSRLRGYQQTIEAAWPPERSPAAREFMIGLDRLVVSMEQTEAAAGRTKHAMNGIMDALETARNQLQPLATQYAAKADDLILRQIDGAEDDLNVKARKIMADAELAVGQHSGAITAPPQFVSSGVEPGPSGPGGASHGQPGSGSSGRSGSGGAGAVPPVSHNPPAPLPGVNPVLPDGQQWTPSRSGALGQGPTLSGVAGGAGTLPSTGGLPTGVSGVTAGGPGAGAGGPLGGGPFGGGALLPGVLPGARSGLPSGYGRGGGLPSGGAGAGRGGGLPPGSAGAGRAGMPVNGVIGGQPAGGRPGAPGAGAGGLGVGGMPGASGRGRRDGSGRLGEPDVVWEVDEGVPPVTEAPRGEYRHDVGPGVIGIDR